MSRDWLRERAVAHAFTAERPGLPGAPPATATARGYGNLYVKSRPAVSGRLTR